MKKYFKDIEKIVKKNMDSRGLDKVNLPGDFEFAVSELYNSSRVIILTGFCIKSKLVGETDGPLGTTALAYALEKIGKKITIVTDEYSLDLLKICIKHLELRVELVCIPYDNAENVCKDVVDITKPTHIVAIERPGKSIDGNLYSMSAEDISDIIPSFDIFFELSKSIGAKTIAIGDGGNEMGMGKISGYVYKNVKHGHMICARTTADALIPVGISNWGGYALATGLSILSNELLIYDSETERELLECIVSEGAVDGCTKENIFTVDGLSLESNLEIFNQLRNIALFVLKC